MLVKFFTELFCFHRWFDSTGREWHPNTGIHTISFVAERPNVDVACPKCYKIIHYGYKQQLKDLKRAEFVEKAKQLLENSNA